MTIDKRETVIQKLDCARKRDEEARNANPVDDSHDSNADDARQDIISVLQARFGDKISLTLVDWDALPSLYVRFLEIAAELVKRQSSAPLTISDTDDIAYALMYYAPQFIFNDDVDAESLRNAVVLKNLQFFIDIPEMNG